MKKSNEGKHAKRKSPRKAKRIVLTDATFNPVLLQTEIVVSYSGKISTGNYENESPFFSNKEIWGGTLPPGFVDQRQQFLFDKCYSRFTECEKRSLLELIKKKRRDIRFYGDKPSVTSIIGWDADFYVTPEELIQYSARGTIYHAQVRIYEETGEWLEPADIPEIYTQMVIIKQGSLKLTLDGYNYRGFKAKNPFETISTETEVHNDILGYAGRQDIKYKNIKTGAIGLADIKTGSVEKTKCMKQLSAYANCKGNEDVTELMVIPINNKTAQGWSKPIIEEDAKKYLPMFIDDLNAFKERFSL